MDFDAAQQPYRHHHAYRPHNGKFSSRKWGAGDNCPVNYTDAYVDKLLATLTPTVTALQQQNLLQYAYVYGFDELPAACEPEIRKLFGAVKQKFAGLRTVSAINWDTMPADLPVDVWVLQYQLYNASKAAAWIAAGHQQWWYHCIEPDSLANLNTFIERPFLQNRLLFWLAALGNGAPSGWLYYAVDLWNPYPGKPRKVLARSNGTQPFTDFDPANYIWAPQYTDIFANGDGQFVYPGADGLPLATTRLENMRDGLEDWELFAHAPASAAQQHIKQLVRSAYDWTEDARLMESSRRAVAALAV